MIYHVSDNLNDYFLVFECDVDGCNETIKTYDEKGFEREIGAHILDEHTELCDHTGLERCPGQ